MASCFSSEEPRRTAAEYISSALSYSPSTYSLSARARLTETLLGTGETSGGGGVGGGPGPPDEQAARVPSAAKASSAGTGDLREGEAMAQGLFGFVDTFRRPMLRRSAQPVKRPPGGNLPKKVICCAVIHPPGKLFGEARRCNNRSTEGHWAIPVRMRHAARGASKWRLHC
jgi:hypothetical protein